MLQVLVGAPTLFKNNKFDCHK